MTRSFSTSQASFRKDQQILLEAIQDYGKRGITLINGEPVLLWLDNIKVLRELAPGEATPIVVKVESARYGIPGAQLYSVTGMVQSLIAPDTSGTLRDPCFGCITHARGRQEAQPKHPDHRGSGDGSNRRAPSRIVFLP